MSNSGITVTATGSASGPPDRAVLTIGASAVRGQVAEAMEVVNGKLRDLTSVLTAHGVLSADVQTSDLSVWPEHSNDGTVVGFRVRNMVRIGIGLGCTGETAGLGEVVGAAAAALGDLAEIQGLAFEVVDPTALEATARARAWHLAEDKARQLADLAGTRLGKAIDITERHGHDPAPTDQRAFAMAESAPIEAGSASIQVQLIVRFSQFPDESPTR